MLYNIYLSVEYCQNLQSYFFLDLYFFALFFDGDISSKFPGDVLPHFESGLIWLISFHLIAFAHSFLFIMRLALFLATRFLTSSGVAWSFLSYEL